MFRAHSSLPHVGAALLFASHLVAQPSLAAGPATAAPPEAPHADRATDEVIVTATAFRESPLDVAQPVTVMTGEDLRRAMGASLGETVAAAPGVTGSYFGAAASRPIIRGQAGERVLMLEDGADSLDASALSADHAVSVEGLAADQIEILKGPATLLYGNGAVGGLVNVVTHRVPTNRTEGFSGTAEVRGDTALAERSAAMRLDAGSGNFAFHLDAFQRDTGDLRIPGFALTPALRAALAEEGVNDTTRDRLPNSASEARGAAFGTSWFGEQGFLGVAVSRYETFYGIPGPGEEADPAATQWLSAEGPAIDMAQTRFDLRGEFQPTAGPIKTWRLRAAVNHYRHTETEPDGAIGTRFDNDARDLRLLADHAWGGWRGTFGLQWREADLVAAGEEAFVPPSSTRNVAAFFFEELTMGAVTFEFGSRVEQQRITVPGAREQGTSLGLATGMVWRWTEQVGLSVQLTRAERLPGATELFANGPHVAVGRFEIGDATLGKETARTLDVTLHGRGEGPAKWSAGLFVQSFNDFLYLEPDGTVADGLGVFHYRQQDALFTGVEAEWTLPLTPAGAANPWQMRLAGDLVRGKLQQGGGDLPLMPPMRLTAELQHQRGAWSLNGGVQWSAAQRRVAINEPPTRAALAVTADASWEGEWLGMNTNVFLRVNNLLNRDLRRHTSVLKEYVPLPARGIAAGVRISF
jgi:iron complex outermembrane receptor protein